MIQTDRETDTDTSRHHDRQTLKQPGELAVTVRDVLSLLAFTERTDDIAKSKQAAVYVDT